MDGMNSMTVNFFNEDAGTVDKAMMKRVGAGAIPDGDSGTMAAILTDICRIYLLCKPGEVVAADKKKCECGRDCP